MCPEPPHYVPGTVLSSQPGGSQDGRESRPSLRTGPSALGSTAGRPHWAPAPLGSTAVLWPGQPWPGAEHMGALGPGCFHPMLGSMLQGRGAGRGLLTPALQSEDALASRPLPSKLPQALPPDEFFALSSICFPRDSSDPASPTCPTRSSKPAAMQRLLPDCPRSRLGSSFCCGAFGGASLVQRVHGRMSENPAISAQ